MPAARPLVPYPLIAAGWLVVAAAFVVHEYGAARADGREAPLAAVAYWGASEWLVWALITPVVFALVRRLRLDAGALARSLIILALAGVAAALGQIVIQAALDQFVTGVVAGERMSIREWLSGYRSAEPASLDYLVQRKLGFGYVVFWGVVAVGLMVRFYRLAVDRAVANERLERRLAEARLGVVRQQLHPHFLFNSLNGIAELIHEHPDRAERMISYLSELLRRAVRTDDEARVPLGRELGFVRRYVALQRARYGSRLRVDLDVPREARDCVVPPHILQPLVENAIQHGGPAAGHDGAIQIAARIAGHRLAITVRDHGPGPSMPIAERTGLQSTRARLESAFGSDFRLDVTAHADGGTVCRIEMPCQT